MLLQHLPPILSDKLDDLIIENAKQYCPYVGTHSSSYCPVKMNFNDEKSPPKLIGIGYLPWVSASDRMKGVIVDHFQKINQDEKYRSEYYSYIAKNEREYISKSDKNGLFTSCFISHSEDIENLYTKFFGRENRISANVKVISFFSKKADPTQGYILADSFEKIVELLPSAYVEKDYRRFVGSCGSEVIVDAKFGGIIESNIQVRQCLWGKLGEKEITDQLAIESEALLDLVQPRPLNNVYLKRRSAFRINAWGGDVGQGKISDRIATFGTSPHIVQFKTKPITMFISDPQKKKNLEKIIQIMTAEYNAEREKQLKKHENPSKSDTVEMVIAHSVNGNQGTVRNVGPVHLPYETCIDTQNAEPYACGSRRFDYAWQSGGLIITREGKMDLHINGGAVTSQTPSCQTAQNGGGFISNIHYLTTCAGCEEVHNDGISLSCVTCKEW